MRFSIFVFLLVGLMACKESTPPTQLTFSDNKHSLPPNERFGDLFEAVQLAQVFPDGKTFVDCTPRVTTDEIMAEYSTMKSEESFDLKAFVNKHFDLPKKYASDFKADTNKSVDDHINSLWPVLTRTPDQADNGSLIPLPHPYIVPGGRFGEIYYWDSYFTMLGLQAAGKNDMVKNMIDNFAHIIDEIGFIPNGNRTYFLTRSQPPFFAKMVSLLADVDGDEVYLNYLPQLEKEYAFWMEGDVDVDPAHSTDKHLVYLDEEHILNRYYDKGNYPRAESYREDIETAEQSKQSNSALYQNLRAACESGWDFSSRWFSDVNDLSSIHTTDIIPVDLNALLHHLEIALSKAYKADNQEMQSQAFIQLADRRKAGILKYCWSVKDGYFMDYDYIAGKHTSVLSAAGTWVLEEGLATPKQADISGKTIREKLLQPGGIVSTLNDNGQQWDYPNGWAPQQWMAIAGLRRYDQNELADEIKQRWINLNTKIYKNTGKLVEKYNVVDLSLEAGGGEYPVQDGFGWTNGVLLKLLKE